jgi:hypothetical protein
LILVGRQHAIPDNAKFLEHTLHLNSPLYGSAAEEDAVIYLLAHPLCDQRLGKIVLDYACLLETFNGSSSIGVGALLSRHDLTVAMLRIDQDRQ